MVQKSVKRVYPHPHQHSSSSSSSSSSTVESTAREAHINCVSSSSIKSSCRALGTGTCAFAPLGTAPTASRAPSAIVLPTITITLQGASSTVLKHVGAPQHPMRLQRRPAARAADAAFEAKGMTLAIDEQLTISVPLLVPLHSLGIPKYMYRHGVRLKLSIVE